MIARKRRIWSHVFDWKFLTALSVFLMVTYLTAGGLSSAHENRGLVAAVKKQTDDAADARKAATTQRLTMLRAQGRLLRQFGHLQHKQDSLLRYLRDAGVQVPSSLDAPNTAPRIDPQTSQGPSPGPRPRSGAGGPVKPHHVTPSHPHAGGGGSGGTPAPAPQPAPGPEPTPPPLLCVLVVCVG